MKKLSVFIVTIISILAASAQLSGQNLDHYKKIVKELSSAKYQGRGYAEDGANKAGKWIAKEFAKVGADNVVCQPFTFEKFWHCRLNSSSVHRTGRERSVQSPAAVPDHFLEQLPL